MTGVFLIISGIVLIFVGIFIHIKTTRGNRNIQPLDGQIPENEKVECLINPELESLINIAVSDGVLTDNEREIILSKAVETGENIDMINELVMQKLAKTSVDAETKIIDKVKEKGDSFEKYIVLKFDTTFFKLKEWAGDKYVKGIYAETTINPDLVFCFRTYKAYKVFAVECKYRSQYNKGGIEWAEMNQIKNYRNYQTKNMVPVFVAIGVGGRPDNPDDLFIVPLNKIPESFIPFEKLRVFRKDNFKTNNIYFDVKTLKLC